MYYPEIHPGDIFQPNAALENDVRRLVNLMPSQGSPGEGARPGGNITICVHNAGTESLAANQPVQLVGGTPTGGDIVPVEGFTTMELPWGILLSPLVPGGIGECLLHGMATVTLDAVTGHYAQPTGTAFSHGTSGLPILAEYADGTVTRGIVSTAASASGGTITQGGYDGPFAVELLNATVATVSGGVVRRADVEDTVSGGTCAFSVSSVGIYLAARYNTTTYDVTYGFYAATDISGIPCPSGYTQYAHRLALVVNGTVTQSQYGDIAVTGVWL